MDGGCLVLQRHVLLLHLLLHLQLVLLPLRPLLLSCGWQWQQHSALHPLLLHWRWR